MSLALVAAPDAAQPQAGFATYIESLAARGRAVGVSEATIARMTAGLTYNPRVVALDRAQLNATPSSYPAFAAYRRAHVDAARIARGRAAWASASPWLPQIERQYGVPAGILLAIWGNETNYGADRGDFDLSRSLATLAYEGRRRDLFANEFVALLQIADRGVPRSVLVGSWAGAFGNPQFLPSAYLRYARDGDGDGRIDIWHDQADTLASIANFLRESGWRPGIGWGGRANVSPALDRASVTNSQPAAECARAQSQFSRWLPVREWRARGVVPQVIMGEETPATLIEPDGPGRGGFLLTRNYDVILHYNCSNSYALAVGLLADAIVQ